MQEQLPQISSAGRCRAAIGVIGPAVERFVARAELPIALQAREKRDHNPYPHLDHFRRVHFLRLFTVLCFLFCT